MNDRPLPVTPDPDTLGFPFPTAPEFGNVTEVAPGILWLRLPLPYRLDHVNIYLIEDGDGWTIVDAGISDEPSRAAWEAALAGPLAGFRMKRLIVTHYHPDHIGLAGWLCERFGIPLLTSQTSFVMTTNISLSPGALDAPAYREIYLRHGASAETADIVATSGHGYLKKVAPLPPTFTRLTAGDELEIGGRHFEVMVGEGHAPEQIMLYCRSERILLAADQVIEKITPNIGVWAVDPDGDPLGLYLRSMAHLTREVDADALVLAGHRLPFYGLHARCVAIIDHHEERCARILEAVQEGPRSANSLLPVLFRGSFGPHELSFAFSEALAHVNYMVRRGRLAWKPGTNRPRLLVPGSVR